MTRNEEIILAYKERDTLILSKLAKINIGLLKGFLTQEEFNENAASILKEFCASYHRMNDFQTEEELRYFDSLKIDTSV